MTPPNLTVGLHLLTQLELALQTSLATLECPGSDNYMFIASKNEFHDFTRYGLQTKSTSPHIIHLGKGLPGIQSIPSEIRVFKCRQTRTTSVAYYILTEISTGILLLLPSQQLKSQLLLLSSLVVPPALSNQIEV